MKKALSVLVLAGLTLTPAFAQKIGVVDVDVIRQKYGKAIENAKRIQDKIADAKKLVAEREAGLVKLREEAQTAEKETKNPTLNDAARATKQGEFQSKAQAFLKARDEYTRMQQEIGANIQQSDAALSQELLREVREKSVVVAKEKSLDIVLPSGITLFSSESVDVTQDVLKKLNEAYAANPVTPSAPVTEAPKPATK